MMDPLSIFRPNTDVKRVYLPPPTSRKYIPQNMDAIDQELEVASTTETLEGTEYADYYVKEEEERVLAEASATDCKDDGGKFDMVSQGTVSVLNELQTEELMKIYKTYNFAYRPKENLTIVKVRERIVSMVETNSVVVIEGPTGCGKTTQVPQFLLDNSHNKKVPCNIIVTQPRRIAAISIAQRVSKERGWTLGSLVGYQVGMCNVTSSDTRLTYCTTGVLLRKLIRSKNMLDYTHIILDEVHERSQEMDFLMLVVRKLLRSNSRQVKVILMSATFDVTKFAHYFNSPMGKKLVDAPIVDVGKKSRFNLSIYYLCQMGAISLNVPEVSATEPRISLEMMQFCESTIIVLDKIDRDSDFDDLIEYDDEDEDDNDTEQEAFKRHVVLIFLPGIMEIEELNDILRAPCHSGEKWDIVVLHSSITSEEQQKIFQKPPKNYRRIILSTNIAESSITVPDVKYVIDFCLTKQLVTNPATNFQSLELTWASKANCDQRAGRTGRVMDGRVYRLVPKAFYETLPKDSEPEMLRAPLENLVLNAKMLDMGEPKSLLALSLDPPDLSNLKRTILILKEIGALFNSDEEFNEYDGKLTDLGRVMSNLPMDVRIAKLIALGHVFSVIDDTIIMAASMACKSMFSNPFQMKLDAYKSKISWADTSCSDCIASLSAFKVWQKEKANRRITNSQNEKSWAQSHFIQVRVLREIHHFVNEISQRLNNLGIVESVGENKVVWSDTERAFVHKIVIAGAFYPNYFVKSPKVVGENGKNSLKLVSGMNPGKTVYLQGWPTNQPGVLYAKRIQELVRDCIPSSVGKIIITFDNSSRIYIHFWNKDRRDEDGAPNVTEKISMAVYRAVKLRKINSTMAVKVMDTQSSITTAKKLGLLGDRSKTFFDEKPKIFEHKKNFGIRPILPGLDMSMIPLKITQIINPGHFWAQMIDLEAVRKLDKLLWLVNNQEGFLLRAPTEPELESLVFAPLSNEDKSYHRALVQSYSKEKGLKVAHLLYIDCGKSALVQVNDLRILRSFSEDDEEDVELEECFNLPALAFECILANLRPTFMSSITGEWSLEASIEFDKLLRRNDRDKQLNIYGEIYSVVNSVVALTLHIKRGIDENVKPINVNEFLIDRRYAEGREENYLSRQNHELRSQNTEMGTSQKAFYEEAQYDQNYSQESYPEPPDEKDCGRTVLLRGPFSPLEMELIHLTGAGASKKINIEGTSVNSVLLDSAPEDPHERLLVAGFVNESPSGNNLTLRDTTLMPNVPGLAALLTMLFTSKMELRRSPSKSYFIGALCGAGAHPETGKPLFPEHDMELKFDVKFNENDIHVINKIRYYMNLCLNIDSDPKEFMRNSIECQVRIKHLFLELMDQVRVFQEPETISQFNKWNLYPEEDMRQPGKFMTLMQGIYPLHFSLQLTEESEKIKELRKNQLELLELARTDVRNRRTVDTFCFLCERQIAGVFELRAHLFSKQHQTAVKHYGIS